MGKANAYGRNPHREFTLTAAIPVVMGTASVVQILVPHACKLLAGAILNNVAGGGSATPSVITIKRNGATIGAAYAMNVAGDAAVGQADSFIVATNVDILFEKDDIITLDNNGASDSAASTGSASLTFEKLLTQ